MNDKTSSATIARIQARKSPPPSRASSAKCEPKANQVTFFQHANYKGACAVRNTGRYPNSKAIGIGNDKISSIKIGSGSNVNLCKDSNFRGTCKNYTTSMTSLGKMNDQTSSAIISRSVPQKAPPYVLEQNNTPSSSSTDYHCDEYGLCTCSDEDACLSMGSENGPCVTNEYNEAEYACDEIGCACYQSGSIAAIENPSSICGSEGIVSMNGIVGMNGRTPVCSNNLTLSETIIGAKISNYEGNEEEEELQTIVSPQQSPPYVYEKDDAPSTLTTSSNGAGKFALSAPSELSVDGVTSTTVTLSWFDNSDREYGVEVYRIDPVEARRNRTNNWVFVGLFEERNSSFVKGTGWRSDEDYDLNPDTNYCYKLRSYIGFDRLQFSDYSKSACTVTNAINEAPAVNQPKVTVKRR
jgi:hypothetical protein